MKKVEKETEIQARKEVKFMLMQMSNGGCNFSVSQKRLSLNQTQAGVYFGKCSCCALNREGKFIVNASNPIDPSIKARVKCGVVNELWVSPMMYDGNSECSRRDHVVAKKMRFEKPHTKPQEVACTA